MLCKSFSTLGLTALLLITGCAQTRQTLGLERSQPDEFSTLDRPPLSMPPSLNLKPPVPSQRQSQEGKMVQDKAKNLILPSQTLQKGSSSVPSSASATELLSKAKVDERQEDIRRVIDEEAKTAPSQDDLASKILYWQKPESTEAVVDPTKEPQKYTGDRTAEKAPLPL